MVSFETSYKEYHLKEHKTEWTGNILDTHYLEDLKESIE